MMPKQTQPRWRDTAAVAELLHDADRQLLLLLSRLPLVPVAVMRQVRGTAGPAAVYRRLARLAAAGLATSLHAPLGARRAARLWLLTDLGVATLAWDQGVDPRALARAGGLSQDRLLTALRRLPGLLARYRLLGALAIAGPGVPRLLAWEQPWRYAYHQPGGTGREVVRLPAAATYAWTSGGAVRYGQYLLLPDLATVPLAAQRALLARLFACRTALEHAGRVLPPLLIATAVWRVDAWRVLLEEERATRRDVALAASVLAWESLDANLGAVVAHTVATQPPASLRQWPALPALSAPLPERPVPRFVGAGPAARRPLALTVHEPEWALLDLLARHLLLPCDLVAVALGWSDTIMRRRCSALAQQGLVRLIEAAELGQGGREAERYADLVARRPYEVTATGLAALAAWQGLTTRAAIRCNGYAGGGPDQPCGDRASRLAAPWHTLGVETLFASLAHGARRAVRHGADAGLIEWRNAAASTWDRFRPDAYLVYRHGAAHYAAFLEYDRGTMGRRDWRQKLSAYYAYRDSGFYRRDYAGFPTLLIVITTADAGAGDAAIRAAATEDLIAGVLSDLAISRAPLPALLTTEQRVQVDPAGFLGPIWREATSAARRTWPLAAGSSQSRPPTLARPAWQPRLPPDEQDDDRDAPLPGARAPPPHTIPP